MLEILKINRCVWTGSLEEHQQSAQSLWAGCEDAYPERLSHDEAEIYLLLDERKRAAFRILRDLAIRRDAQGVFFMAGDHLGMRIAPCGSVNGWRVLKDLCSDGIIEPQKKGVKRAKGQAGVAAYYRWRLPLPEKNGAETVAIPPASP